ncbi:hypothetical protein [Streptomyces sp. CBMA123]|uniref:hypothetical protein n=1 Tax=Streptomyces sp. CBMA123 TaxID=1896313 RepID=UPI001661D389|nr:hypothetical protein [Streptomyces sp. CBMA123]MBD0690684.1 hypothetical protein [Streptomyces sp. CBMA123]
MTLPSTTAPSASAGPRRAAKPGRSARSTALSPGLQRAALRATGTVLALAAAGTGTGTLTDRLGPVCLLPIAAVALWAAVPAPDGPTPTRRLARLAATRTTLLAAGAVPLAALGDPSWWRALAVTVLLAGYLLVLDALGPHRPTIRPATAAAALTAALLVLPPAFAPTAAGEWSRPLAVLGLTAAAVGVALALRPERTPPQAPPDQQPHDDRPSAG